MSALTFKKIKRGCYATEDGTYATVVDGYERGQHVGAEGDWKHGSGYDGFVGGEWAAVYDPNGRADHNGGENLNWFATKREAVAECQAHFARKQRERIQAGTVCGTCADEGETSCNCWDEVTL